MASSNRDTFDLVEPLGEALKLEDLPPPENARWTIRRKADVVAALDRNLLTFDEACERYRLSVEELTGWQRAVRHSGMQGLRVTRIQQCRDFYERDDVAKRKPNMGVERFLAALSG